jgi:hypothetical protein
MGVDDEVGVAVVELGAMTPVPQVMHLHILTHVR